MLYQSIEESSFGPSLTEVGSKPHDYDLNFLCHVRVKHENVLRTIKAYYWELPMQFSFSLFRCWPRANLWSNKPDDRRKNRIIRPRERRRPRRGCERASTLLWNARLSMHVVKSKKDFMLNHLYRFKKLRHHSHWMDLNKYPHFPNFLAMGSFAVTHWSKRVRMAVSGFTEPLWSWTVEGLRVKGRGKLMEVNSCLLWMN